MANKNATPDGDPELRRLHIEEREAEVKTKKARAEKEEAEAHRKRREAGIVEDDPETDDKLSGGIVREKFVTIFRKIPGEARWPFWKKHVPLDEIDSVEQYIADEGDPRYEHKVVVHNEKGKAIKKPIYFPATEADPGAVSGSNTDREIKELERQLADRKKAKKAERLRRRLEEEDDEEEGGEGEMVYVPHVGGYFPAGHPMTMGMMPPWMQQPQQQPANQLKDFMPLLVAWISRPQEKSPILEILPLILSSSHKGQLEPKDMLQMLSPFVMKMSEMNAESSRVIMEGMSKMDDAFRKKMLDLLMSDPNRTPDEIEKWQRWINLGETALRKGATIIRDATKGAPLPGPDGKRRIELRKPPAPAGPGPKKEGDGKTEERGGDKAATAEEQPAAAPADPKEAAALLRKKRVESFLLATEEELLAESDPSLVAEAIEEIYLSVPKGIRAAIEDAAKDDPIQDEKLIALFSTLKELCPEITERIAAALMEDTEKAEWMKDFLHACAFPEEEEDGGEAAEVGAPSDDGPEEDPGE